MEKLFSCSWKSLNWKKLLVTHKNRNNNESWRFWIILISVVQACFSCQGHHKTKLNFAFQDHKSLFIWNFTPAVQKTWDVFQSFYKRLLKSNILIFSTNKNVSAKHLFKKV